MAKIQELLDNLLHKKLGRDVRQSIHDSIEQCYKDATGHPESVAGVIEENKNMQKQLDSNINTINGRIDTILTGAVNTTKLVTVHSATIRNNSASDLTFKISSKDNETLKSIKDKSPTVINANVIAKALDGVAINGASIPSSYNVESTKDEYSITVYSGSSSVVGQYVFMAVVTIAYKDTATDISSAELKDIRTGANGTTYPTAGDAVREQINDLKKELDDSNLDENVSQIQQNMKDISQLKESLDNYRDVNNNCFEHENIDNGSTIKNSTIDYNNGNPISPGFGVQVKTDAPILSVSIKIKASASDNLICSILKDDTVVCFDSKPVTTNLSELVFEFPRNYVNGVVTIRLKTENNSNISYSTRAGGYTSDIMPEYNGQYLFEQYNNKEWSQVYSTINTMLLYVKSRKTFTVKESVSKAIKEEKIVNYVFVATSGNDATGDGTEENPYATIYKANETITDSSETNKYEIIVKQGTYTDLQEKYSGVDGNSYQGVVCKPYVTYRSENILKPDLCVLKWDGADGYTKPVTDANCVNKCLFHIPTNSKGIYIKGFTFESKNTRYCMHIETTGSTDECDWHFENCVFNWGGRPDTTEDGTVATACIGTGYSMLEFGEFINCIIKCTNTNHANHMVFQSHDNPDNMFTSIKRGEHLRFENCYFSIADGSDYAHIDLRTTKTSPIIPSFAEFINCSGIKLYVPSETYKKSFVCTEQHTTH